MQTILWEFLNDFDEDIDNYNVNFFSRLTNDCLTIDMSICNMTILSEQNLLMVESKKSESYSVIDLDKVVMIEFIQV